MKPKLDLIGIIVRDMAASLAFYRQLGFEIPASADAEKHVEYLLEGGIRFAWDTLDVIQSFDSEFILRPEHVGAFLCEDSTAVDTLFHSLVGAGYEGHRAPWDAFWGQRYAIIKDPDGHLVDLFAALEPTPS